MTDTSLPTTCDVAIIGAGPAGLATAIELKKLGISGIIVLERQSVAGGTPRNCGHSVFGMREFNRVYFGAKYADKLVAKATEMGIHISLDTTVISLGKNRVLQLSTNLGISELQAKRVVLSTGIQEKPRSARLISGSRPMGITTTGALQSTVYLNHKKPFKSPVIIGSELVSFSALMTCRHVSIKPVAMIEPNRRITTWSIARLLPLFFGIKVMLNTKLIEIIGKKHVSAVKLLKPDGSTELLECDGVVFTGQFIPESALARLGELQVDHHTQGPVVDQFGRCSDTCYFATGNLLRAVETAGWCWSEGIQTAKNVANSLSGKLPDTLQQTRLEIASPKIKYVVPQVLSHTDSDDVITLQIHVTEPASGRLSISSKSGTLLSKKISSLPERRISLKVPAKLISQQGESLQINFYENL